MSDQRTTTTIEPVRCQVTVRCRPERAFEAYTAEMGRWWPTTRFAIEPGRVVDIVVDGRVGGSVRERLDDGTEYEWAAITAWEPPNRLGLSWHPSKEPTVSSDVDIRFVDQGDGTTLVDVTHSGWERFGADAAETRASYDNGWQVVIGLYAEHADRG